MKRGFLLYLVKFITVKDSIRNIETGDDIEIDKDKFELKIRVLILLRFPKIFILI